ncbi:MAG: carboxypeptidase regulatory-like domain-containing protein [Acidobacteriaceae bacterium]|nr:carboxypeptidase regulatory-like domain-containing protein [Acidobacteriaceae bacterium]
MSLHLMGSAVLNMLKPKAKRVVQSMFLLGVATGALAQTTTTSIVGRVLDPSGAVVPKAQVVMQNKDTNQELRTLTDSHGEYRIDLLPAGTYDEKVTASGYKTTVQPGLVLYVGQVVTLNASLSIGEASTTVEVSTAQPIVNTTNSEIGETITSREITDLPLVDRNAYTLLDIIPGVQNNQNSIVFGYPEQRTIVNGGYDAGTGSVNYFLDGGPNLTGLRNTGNITPNPDALQEFRVQTNGYSAEYGRFPGGIINAITKSGTNDFHGTVFEFNRNQALAARTYGSDALPKAPLNRNQFGGTLGGPLRKDKLFFFGSYAGLRQDAANFVNSAVVPTEAERSGDFSGDAATALPVDISGTTPALFACGGVVGKICSTQLDPSAVKIMNDYIPHANVGTNLWQGYLATSVHSDDFLAKLTANLSERQHLNVLYFNTSGNSLLPANSSTNLPWANIYYHWRQQNSNIVHDYVISPSLINQTWITYTRNFAGRVGSPGTGLDDLDSSFTTQGTKSLPYITVTGYFTLGNAVQGPVAGTNFYSVRDMLTWTHGRHSIRFGGESSLDKDIQQITQTNYGVFSFGTTMTAGTVNKVKYTGNALAAFEIGSPTGVSQGSPVTGYTNSWNTALFLQDDYRILPRLTLNLGIRWDIQTPPTDPENKEGTYIAGRQSVVRPTAPVGQLFPGDAGVTRGITPVRWNHISPRVGFAYDLFGNSRTSIRGGAGLFWGSTSGNEWNQMENFVPWSLTFTFTNAGSITGARLSDPYKNLAGGNPYPYSGGWPVAGAQIYGISTDYNGPYIYHGNFSVQQQLTNTIGIQIAYVGALAHALPFSTDVNYPVLDATAKTGAASALARRPNPLFGQVALTKSNQTASYHALQVTGQKRIGSSFTMSAFYIWSKAMSSTSMQTQNTNSGAQDFNKLGAERGLSDYDIRNQFVASLIWRSHLYSGRSRWIGSTVNDWGVSLIAKVHTGNPYNLLNGGDANLDGSSSYDRPELVGNSKNIAVRSNKEWFNTAAFAYNTPTNGNPVDGNTPRNYIIGPGYRDIDLSLTRNFHVTRKTVLQVRADGSNAFNMATFTTPATNQRTITSSLFGQLNTTNPNRLVQLGAKLLF